MKDIQNTQGDYKFDINKVGVDNLVCPFKIQSKIGEVISTVGNFSMMVNLPKELKGINMSRLPQLLSELKQEELTLNDLKQDIRSIVERMKKRMESKDAYLDLDFDYFLEKKAPVSGFMGIVPYHAKINASLQGSSYNFILTVEVPITTLCPCSKEISDYSAHNQRGYVEVSIKFDGLFYIEDIIEIVEEVASCEIYSVLKRVDEKYVTERAYENPRFVEDVVRLVAEKLDQASQIKSFSVSSRHQESIHSHDAYAIIER
ncbi:GTP cyclohydrolase FolE2 [Orenia marismortui]|uniref:GTP cyclohydrolase FolE2 n=1 Tax=Orenia marismortui TaxID=46469 RepID=A0A4R8H668_9FIRM|nr:GTP cyclohydrolase FolE2 [Orenia marismortui]TDX52956.1 GTP cyclohydrolase I [Orenia marismortui]